LILQLNLKDLSPIELKHKQTRIAMIGAGISGVDFLLSWQEMYNEIQVDVFECSNATNFFLDALFSIKGKKLLPVSGKKNLYQVENIRINLCFQAIAGIDTQSNIIHHKGGKLEYDFLLLVNEYRPKIFSSKAQLLSLNWLEDQLFGINSGEDADKLAVIEGNGLSTIAFALKLLDFDLIPTIVCGQTRLADEIIPEEEAWLFGKKFKNKSVNFNFESGIEKFLTNEARELTGVRLRDGQELPVCMVIIEEGETPFYPYIAEEDFISGNTFKTKIDHCVQDYQNIYAVGENIKVIGQEDEGKQKTIFPFLLERSNVIQKQKHFDFKQYVFHELFWNTYGDITPDCGNDTQIFYWEHPGGDVSFRMHYSKENFSIMGVACLGICFKKAFISNAIEANWKADHLIDQMADGLINNKYSKAYSPLIKKSFGVEFRKVVKNKRSPFFKRIIKKFFALLVIIVILGKHTLLL